MPFYSEELISEVIAANDIVDLISEYVRLKKSGSGYMGCCPFHKEKTPSFHVSADKQLYHCFGCGAGGSALSFVMNSQGMEFQDALKLLAQRGGINLPEIGDETLTQSHKKKARMYEMNREAAKYFRECLLSEKGSAAREYLLKRGLSGKTIASFGLGFSPDEWGGLLEHLKKRGYSRELAVETGLCIMNDNGHVYDRFRGRIMYPIIDVRGNVIGFGGRIMSGDGAKYMNSPESIIYDKGKNLFALYAAKKSERGSYILVEGYMDVISLHQAGIDNAVAGCGTALTEAQARLISKGTVYLCYDSDEAGQKALSRAAEIFSKFETRLRVITIPKCKDADEFVKKYGGQAFDDLIKNAKTVTQHKLDALCYGKDLNDTAIKVEITEKAAVIFAAVDNEVERELYIKQLAARCAVSVESIYAEVRKINRKNVRHEVYSDIRKSVGTSREAVFTRRENTRRIQAERGLLSLLCDSERVYNNLSEKIGEGIFSVDIHKKIYENVRRYYSEGAPVGCAEYLIAKMPENERELSEVLINKTSAQNALAAAQDFLLAIEDEIFSEKLAAAQKSGDVKLISQLLKEKKHKGGK